MLVIGILKRDVPALTECGVPVIINGTPETLTRNGDWLCYGDNRCRIIDEVDDGRMVSFAAASHGCEDQPHIVIRPGPDKR